MPQQSVHIIGGAKLGDTEAGLKRAEAFDLEARNKPPQIVGQAHGAVDIRFRTQDQKFFAPQRASISCLRKLSRTKALISTSTRSPIWWPC